MLTHHLDGRTRIGGHRPRDARARLFAVLLGSLTVTGSAGAQDVIIGGSATQVVNISSGTTPYNTLVLGNTATGDGTLNFSGGTIDVTHSGGYSGFVTVGNLGVGTINHGNADGNAVVNITGPAYVGPPPSISPDPWGGYLFIGRSDGSVGTYTITDFGNSNVLQLNVQNEIQIGGSNVSTVPGGAFSCSATCTGAFVQDGGAVTAGGVTIGIGTGTGTYTISSGTLDIGTPDGPGGIPPGTGSLLVGDVGQGSFVMTAGTLTIHNDNINIGAFIVGNQAGSVGTFTQSGGQVNGGRGLSLAQEVGSAGTYNLNTGSDPTLNVGILVLGYGGTGIFNQQTGTTNTVAAGLFMGNTNGTYNLSGGDLIVGGQGIIGGVYQTSTFNQSGGTVNTSALSLGQHDISSGTYVITNGVLNVSGEILVGRGDTTASPGLNGLFQQSGGTVTADSLRIGGFTEVIGSDFFAYMGTGRYELSGGTLITGNATIGDTSVGTFEQTGGVHTTGSISLGGCGGCGGTNSFGTYNISGNGVLNAINISDGIFGRGEFHQSGTSIVNLSNTLTVGTGPETPPGPPGIPVREGIYTLSGGDLIVGGHTILGAGNSFFAAEPGGKGTFTQSGGTHTVGTLLNPRDLTIGQAGSEGGGTGLYQMSGGQLTVNGQLTVGDGGNAFAGNGTFVQTGGLVTANALVVGSNGGRPGVIGTYTLDAGDVNVTNLTGGGVTYIGGFAAGTMTQNGGTFTSNYINVGILGNSHGTYTLNNGTVTANNNLGVGGDGTGSFVQNGGQVFVNDTGFGMYVGGNTGGFATPGSTGTYTLNAGSLAVANSVYVGNDGVGTFNQTGGTHTIGANNGTAVAGKQNLHLGANANGNGTYNMSSGDLTVWGNSAGNNSAITVGGAGAGLFVQTGGIVTAHGFNSLAIGESAGALGEYRISNGTLTATGNVLIGVNGTAVMTMDGASMQANTVIVGATATSVATLDMKSGSTIQAGSVFGIGHDGTQSTGGVATVYVNSGSSITATNLFIGANGCLGGSGGVIHANVVMDGVTGILGCNPPIFATTDLVGVTGIANPGRSPGRLVIDGGFQFISGTIVLEVFDDGLGGFLTDELVFTAGSTLDLTNMDIVFAFMGAADPNAFATSGLWILDTFFKTNPNPDGAGPDAGISTILAPGETLDDLFAQSEFAAQSPTYVIEEFTFDPDLGVTSIVAVPNEPPSGVPEPGTLLLVLLGTLLLTSARARRVQAGCWSQARASATAVSQDSARPFVTAAA